MKKTIKRFIPIIVCLLVLIGTQITQPINTMSNSRPSNIGGITTLGSTPDPAPR